MRKPIPTDLPQPDAPFEWAVAAGDTIHTSHIPVRQDGSFETGSAEAQATLTFANLRRAIEAAGGTLDDIVQVLISITNASDFAAINAVYKQTFSAPYPNRATVIVAGLLAPGTLIEVVAAAYVPRTRQRQ